MRWIIISSRKTCHLPAAYILPDILMLLRINNFIVVYNGVVIDLKWNSSCLSQILCPLGNIF